MKEKLSADELATPRQKELIRAYGWKLPPNCTKKRASGMIYAAKLNGLQVSKEYARKEDGRRAKEAEKDRIENEKLRREYEADEARDIAEWRKMTKTREPKGCLAAMFGLF